MRLKAHEGDKNIPPFGLIEYAVVVLEHANYALSLVGHEELMLARRKDPQLRGRPTRFSVTQQPPQIHVFPTPDEPCEVCLRYYPPMVEF